MGDTQDFSNIARRAIELGINLWATVIFQGFIFGAGILFLRYSFEPYLINNFSDVISIDVPEWLYFIFGIALVVLIKSMSGQPLLRDKHREQFEAVEYIVKKLPELEQTQIYRLLARKMIEDFRLDSELSINLVSETNKLSEKAKD